MSGWNQFIRNRHLRTYLNTWNLGLTFKNWSLPLYRKREMTFILLLRGDFLAHVRFPCVHNSFTHVSSPFVVSTCLLPWCSGSLRWVTSISTLKQFIICWKDKRTNAVTEMKIRILCVKTRVFKLKDCLFIVKYKMRIERKHMPTVEQLWTHTLCLLCAFFYSHFVIHLCVACWILIAV